MSNLGNFDRIARVILGAVLVALPFVLGFGLWGMLASIAVGVVLVVTAITGFCPIYRVLGLSSRRRITHS